jgi:hypothetical protein
MLVVLQGSLLTVTNTFEGNIFVDQNTSATVQVADYVSQLFPNFGPQEANAAAAQYAGLGTNLFQVNAIMGECEYPSFSQSIAWMRQLILIRNWQQSSSVLLIFCYVVLTIVASRLVFLSTLSY